LPWPMDMMPSRGKSSSNRQTSTRKSFAVEPLAVAARNSKPVVRTAVGGSQKPTLPRKLLGTLILYENSAPGERVKWLDSQGRCRHRSWNLTGGNGENRDLVSVSCVLVWTLNAPVRLHYHGSAFVLERQEDARAI